MADNPHAFPHRKRSSSGRIAIGWIISLACLAFIAWNVDLSGTLAALRAFEWPYLVIGLLSLTFGYTMRIARWAVMLRAAGVQIGLTQCAAPFLSSIALNNILPLRAGDIIRATIFPLAIGVPRISAVASIVMERLIDLLTLLLCLAIGMATLRAIRLPAWLADGAVLFALVGTVSLLSIFLFSGPLARLAAAVGGRYPPGTLIRKACSLGTELLVGFQRMSGPGALLSVVVLSALSWIGEMGLFWSLMAGFGFKAGPLTALLVMSFVTLSTLVPSSPGYVGPFHLAAFSIIVLLGATEEAGTSFAVLSHLMLWVPTTLAGGIAMLVRPEIFRSALAKKRGAAGPTERII